MDLGGHSSSLESVTDNELVSSESLGETGSLIKNNGKCHVDDRLLDAVQVEGFGGSLSATPSVTTKGWGLKNWRRVHRDVGKSANSNLDGSVSTRNAMVKVNLYGDSEMEGGPILVSREDSENGMAMDGGSRSSMAASAPRMSHEMLPVVGEQGKVQSVIRKKARGVKMERENSQCSMESDSQSSNFVFIQGSNSVTDNGKKHLNMEASAAFSKNKAESEDFSQDLAAERSCEVKEENGENHVGSKDHDVLEVSMMKFHSVQSAIEREVQQLKNVGKEDPSLFDDSIQPSAPINVERYRPSFHSKTADGDLQTEPEEIFKDRMEVEVQCIVIRAAVQGSKAGQLELMAQQKKVASEQVVVMKKLECAESKARELKKQAEKVKVTCEEILERGEVLKLQNRVCRLSLYFTVQLIMFVLVVYLCLLQFFSHHRNHVLVPT